MKLNGLEIQLKEFSKSMRGYDVEEVKRFLDEVARQIESLDFENRAIKDKLREKDLVLLEYKEREGMLRETMTTAQKVTDNIKRDATKESLQIITQAQLKAESMLRESRQSLKTLTDEINRLKRQKMELASNLRSTLESQMRMLNHYENEKDGTETNTTSLDDTVPSYPRFNNTF